ncbi:MAG TPA: class I SAM-dependent methyltransferase [Tepidisphaeraceae bacterium]|nr:class I SAM-dependent methyltransferase [Tepidisphaeraceae bacterium]
MTIPRDHWQNAYLTQSESQVSWHEDDPQLSLELIAEYSTPQARVIDIGGGSSVLAGRLLERGYCDVAVLDISPAALDRAKARIGKSRDRIRWIAADITQADKLGSFDIWHDRAVFHFLTAPRDRQAYVFLANKTIVIGGHLIIGTFALSGPEKCSGLPVERYDARKLALALGSGFRLIKEIAQTHSTPMGQTQDFIYAVFERVIA